MSGGGALGGGSGKTSTKGWGLNWELSEESALLGLTYSGMAEGRGFQVRDTASAKALRHAWCSWS